MVKKHGEGTSCNNKARRYGRVGFQKHIHVKETPGSQEHVEIDFKGWVMESNIRSKIY